MSGMRIPTLHPELPRALTRSRDVFGWLSGNGMSASQVQNVHTAAPKTYPGGGSLDKEATE